MRIFPMPVFVRLTLALTAAVVAVFVVAFILKIVLVAAVLAALLIGATCLVSALRKSTFSARMSRTPTSYRH
ncbi:MAG: hypothetical protein M3Z14_03095 [Candidatus Eremiobacteraeota bacterium]|nr:hypothetical protein [Candidatus Eremiobacteraeota bacterium]